MLSFPKEKVRWGFPGRSGSSVEESSVDLFLEFPVLNFAMSWIPNEMICSGALEGLLSLMVAGLKDGNSLTM